MMVGLNDTELQKQFAVPDGLQCRPATCRLDDGGQFRQGQIEIGVDDNIIGLAGMPYFFVCCLDTLPDDFG